MTNRAEVRDGSPGIQRLACDEEAKHEKNRNRSWLLPFHSLCRFSNICAAKLTHAFAATGKLPLAALCRSG